MTDRISDRDAIILIALAAATAPLTAEQVAASVEALTRNRIGTSQIFSHLTDLARRGLAARSSAMSGAPATHALELRGLQRLRLFCDRANVDSEAGEDVGGALGARLREVGRAG